MTGATTPGDLADRVRDHAERLTPAERRVATSMVADPEAVAFGTVADVAARAGSGAASVVRLANKLGYGGFSALQAAVRAELSRSLRPAAERIREPGAGDLRERGRRAATECVEATLGALDPDVLDEVVALLSLRSRPVWIVAGDAASGIAGQFATELSMLRRDVQHLAGSPVRVFRQVADLDEGDVVVVVDLRRYDAWVLEVARFAADAGATIVAVTDGPLSPLASLADHAVTVAADGIGPFDNYVGALALLTTVTAGVAQRLRTPAAAHLDRIEAAWRSTGSLTDPG